MEFLSLSRRRSSSRNIPRCEERGETDVFAGYFPSRFAAMLQNKLHVFVAVATDCTFARGWFCRLIRCTLDATGFPSPATFKVLYSTANDPETANGPQNGQQMILNRKWSPKSTANDPVKNWGIWWILWDWLQKRTDYEKGTFFSRPLKKKGRRTPHLRSIYKAKKME